MQFLFSATKHRQKSRIMVDTSKPKRLKSLNLCRIVIEYLPTINLFRFGLLVGAVSLSTANDIQADIIECGTVKLHHRKAMIGGSEVEKDEWPFIAALYYSSTSEYFCGGTIITRKHVLTAAHCIQMKFKEAKLSHDEITVRLGGYNLTDRSEEDAVNRNVVDVQVHPDWKFNEERYNADIAILVLNESVPFSDHIRPVCMPPANFLMDGLRGTVVGWGRTENETAAGVPRKIEVNALNDTHCYNTDEGISSYASERSFCAEGSGTPNDGDSGGGFFAVDGSGWVQFGTVSFVRPKGTGNTLKVALYMKLSSNLRQWIADKAKESGDKISVATTKTNLKCTYWQLSDAAYGCFLFDLNIRRENFVVENFNGSHHPDKDDDDVEQISFKTGVMASLPRNFGTIFRNLKFLEVSVDTRRICRSMLQNLTHLKNIRFVNSKIEEFDEDSLWDLPNLFSFRLEKGEVELLHADTFSRNINLTRVHILSHALQLLPRNLFQNNLLLQTASFDNNLIGAIDENIFETNANLREVSFKGNRLRHLSQNLFHNNSELLFVDLSSNRIHRIDEHTFATNSKLLSLSLESNELEFLPAQLLQGMVHLFTIHLEKNSLQAIDERFFETNVRLKEIFLESNQLNRIPATLFRNNSQLRILYLSDNSIETIDENLLEGNSLLQKVSFKSNDLVELPGNLFKNNPNLKSINARKNLLETINERTFQFNSRLREVYFEENYVSFLPGKLFENNSLLEIVNFDDNNLEAIDEHTFQTNIYLRYVFLSSNLLTYLPENLFRNNGRLQIVSLDNNLFTTLNENIFSANGNLMVVTLQFSKIQVLPRNLFQGNPHLRFINLGGSFLYTIETDFTKLKYVNYIDLSGNDCIDTIFYNVMGSNNDLRESNERRWPRWTKNLTQFQDLVTANCF